MQKHNHRRSGFTLIELLVVVAIFAILIGFAIRIFGSNSEGDRVGVVTKISKKGMVSKTWEGEMQVGSGNSGIQVWQFTVEKSELVPQIEKLLESGHRAKLHYSQKFIKTPWSGDTTYRIQSVTDLTAIAPLP